jgi:hypothetical protein
MPRVCSICTHMDRVAIETVLGSGTSLRTIAARWSVSKTALLRHRKRHMCFAPAMLPAAEPIGALAQRETEVPQLAEALALLTVADAGTQALVAYQAALAVYDAVRQRDMSGFPGLQAACMQIQERQVELAYQRCLACGIAPVRQVYIPMPKESRA